MHSRLSTAAAPPLDCLLRLTLSRFYASTALRQQLDPDHFYNYYQAEMEGSRDRLSLVPVAAAQGPETRRGVQLAFIGNPRAKKYVYADMLSQLLQVPHISMATLVRQELNPRSSLYKKIANAVNRGETVPEHIILGLLSKRLEDGYYRGEIGFILDGIPRTRLQAEILDQLAEIDLVVNFKCSEDFAVKSHGEGSWKEKLQAYAEQSKQLEDYYMKQEKLLEVQVSGTPVETWQGLLTALHLPHIDAAHFSEKEITGSNVH